MSTLQYIYLACAIAGAIIFILRMILLVTGGFGDAEGGLDTAGDFDGIEGFDGAEIGEGGLEGMEFESPEDIDFDDGGLDNTDLSFRFLSVQGVSSFIMMFGIVGLAIARSSSLALLSLFGAVAAGVFTVWVVSLIFKSMSRLQSDGTMHMANAVGETGTVYLRIPAMGEIGKVSIVIQGALRVLEAVSVNEHEIKTGTKVKVVSIRGTYLVVEPLVEE